MARLLVGLSVCGLTLWLTFRGIDFAGVRATLAGLNYWFVLWGIVSVVLTVGVATVRWRVLLTPGTGAVAWRPVFESVVVGQMLNIVLPMRAGDFVRAYALGRIEGIATGGVVATIAIEKAADLLAQGVAMAVLFLYFSVPLGLTGPGRASMILGAAALIAGVVATRYGKRTVNWIPRLPLVPETYRAILARHSASTIQGLAALRDAKAIAALWSLTALTVGLAASTNYLLFKAFGLDVPVSAAFLLLVVLQFGNAPVSTPGNLGVYHYLTVLVLSAFAVDRQVAVGYAVVLYAVALAPKIILGAVIIAVPGHGSRYRTTFADYLTARAQA
jgi:uncharacterized protein (TIRG00374 family)